MKFRRKRSSDLEDESSRRSLVHDLVTNPGSYLPRILPGRIKRKIKQLEDSQQEWVTGVFLCACGASIILFINVVLTIVAVGMSYSKRKDQNYNFSVLYQGNCSTSKNLARGLHGLINVLSTLMLAASNYCMQCLSAPSRQSIDEAHSRRKWLDIGVPSLKNLRSIGLKRQILWAFLCISSVPIHLIYNSTVFSTLATHEYGIYVASSGFDPNDPPKENLDYPNCFDEHAAKNMTEFYSKIRTFEKLPVSNCQDVYAVDFNTKRGAVIIVTNNPKTGNTSLLYTGTGNWPESVGEPILGGYGWMCGAGGCTKKMLERNTKTGHGKWSISAKVRPMPMVLATVFSDTTYILNSTTPNDFPDVQVSDDERKDIKRLKRRMWEQPSCEELRRFLHDPRGWKNSSWAEAITIQKLDTLCPSYSLKGSSLDFEPSADTIPTWPMHPDSSATGQDVGFTVSHCLSENVNETCQLLFSLPLCLAVILCNVIKVLAMFFTAHSNRKEIFLTVGDAMSSFLSKPDKTTAGDCWFSNPSIEAPKAWKLSSVNSHILQLRREAASSKKKRKRNRKRKRWLHAVNRRYWILTATLISAILSVSGGFLTMAISKLGYIDNESLQGIWNLGFGTVSSSTIVDNGSYGTTHSRFLSMVLLANTPQIIISMAYFLYNKILTSMLLATEYDGYATDRKPLRVSWPKGLQRSTYYLSLPYRYSICLLSASAALHWLISQSLFFVAIIPYSPDGKPIPDTERVTCGFSSISIIFAMSLGVLMVVAILVLAMRRFKSNIPLAGSCSAAISAACHPLSDDEHALKPIMWGEVQTPQAERTRLSTDTNEETGSSESQRDERGCESRRDQSSCDEDQESGVGLFVRGDVFDESGESYKHCSFTSHEVITPSPLHQYA